ncbi:MAG TPA: hypothetical protein PKB03_09695 [Baekduia sp.]|nr:hypothetical protein [Baekduia sp.]
MTGGAYISICMGFALAGGITGRIKGSSFWIWFLISGLVPFIGLAAALLYRYETDVPDIACPGCGAPCKVHDSVCMKCGTEIYLDA